MGLQKAFAVIAGSCSATRVQCLKQVRESHLLDETGFTWDEFCKEFVGFSRQHADNLIRQHDQFGDAYFRLSEIARISPRNFEQIAEEVTADAIEINGQKLALVPENAHKIRAAIQTLRNQVRRAPARPPADVIELRARVDSIAEDIAKSIGALDTIRPEPAGHFDGSRVLWQPHAQRPNCGETRRNDSLVYGIGWINMNVVRTMVAAIAMGSPLAAQWIEYPTTGTPRTRDGKPNLAAPAPRVQGVPDLSGIWQAAGNLPSQGSGDLPLNPLLAWFGTNSKGGLPYRPATQEAMSKRRMKDQHYLTCVTPGGPQMLVLPTMRKIVQTPGLVLILSEYNVHYRQIFTDGRPLPDDPQPTWNGYSVGKWEGDTLVAHSAGYRDDQTLDLRGSPLTNAAKVTERFRRPSFGRLEIEVTVDDPKAYTQPFTVLVKQDLAPDTDLLDAPCTDNEKDLPHLPDN